MFYYGEDEVLRLKCDCCSEAIAKGPDILNRALAEGWTVERINGSVKEFCPECTKLLRQRLAEAIDKEIADYIIKSKKQKLRSKKNESKSKMAQL